MNMSHGPVATPKAYRLERATLDSQQQAALWHAITSVARNAQELLLARESLIYALPPQAIYALHPDQFASVAMIYGMKCDLLTRLRHSHLIERLCFEEALVQNQDT